jgi:hypothetical protein
LGRKVNHIPPQAILSSGIQVPCSLGTPLNFNSTSPEAIVTIVNFTLQLCIEIVNVTEGDVAKAGPEWNDDAEWVVSEQDVPQATNLLGNYPNPFNPSTSIQYALGEETHVTLRIYNTLGQEVATLVDEVQMAGYKKAIWNGTNDFGASVASGVYIYTLEAGNIVKSERMLFMK